MQVMTSIKAVYSMQATTMYVHVYMQ